MTIMRFYDRNEFRIHQSQRIQRNEVRKISLQIRDKKRYFSNRTQQKKGKKEERRKR